MPQNTMTDPREFADAGLNLLNFDRPLYMEAYGNMIDEDESQCVADPDFWRQMYGGVESLSWSDMLIDQVYLHVSHEFIDDASNLAMNRLEDEDFTEFVDEMLDLINVKIASKDSGVNRLGGFYHLAYFGFLRSVEVDLLKWKAEHSG